MSAEIVTRCRGRTCGTQIIFSEIPTGKRHPYDYPLGVCKTCGGNGKKSETIPATLFDQQARSEIVICPKCKGTGKQYTSHYKTCPDANDFRTPKEPEEPHATES